MRTLIILVYGLVFAGCGGSADEETVGKEIADHYNEAMEKARQVEEELKEHAQDLEKAIEEAMDDIDGALEDVEEELEDADD